MLELAIKMPPIETDAAVLCNECEAWFVPEGSWRCPCGFPAAFGVQPGTCDRCGGQASMLRQGHNLRSLCHCNKTAEEMRAIVARWRQFDEEDKAPAPRARAAPEPSLEMRDWWPEMRELVPTHLEEGLLREHLLDLAEQGWSMRGLVVAMTTILKRIKEKKTKVGSMSYLFKALETETKSGRVSRRKT